MSASAVSKPISEIKATEDNDKIYTPMLFGSGKNVLYFGYLAESALPKISGGGFTNYSRKSGSGGFNFVSSKGGSEFETLPKINTEHVSGE